MLVLCCGRKVCHFPQPEGVGQLQKGTGGSLERQGNPMCENPRRGSSAVGIPLSGDFEYSGGPFSGFFIIEGTLFEAFLQNSPRVLQFGHLLTKGFLGCVEDPFEGFSPKMVAVVLRLNKAY